MWAEDAALWMRGRRAGGHDFDSSWDRLMREYPPDWWRDFGIRGPELTGTFAGELEARETAKWLRRAFKHAWNCEPTHLEGLSGALIAFTPGTRGKARPLSGNTI